MKSRNRDIDVFNISMLDVLSGALGAFMIVMIVLLPHYDKDYRAIREENESLRSSLEGARQRESRALEDAERSRTEAEEARKQAEQASRQADDARKEAERERRRADSAERQLAKTFMVVYIRWEAKNQDIDLHVINPSGKEFYFDRQTIEGHPGELSEDSKVRPGNEIWEIRNARRANTKSTPIFGKKMAKARFRP